MLIDFDTLIDPPTKESVFWALAAEQAMAIRTPAIPVFDDRSFIRINFSL
jgi:hypothetical protein